ncbi:MAG: TlpA family protein disulfide reductase [Clostridia bacterium]|nr:TlpA family protein disulfide reductase [Clostridia bacterium]
MKRILPLLLLLVCLFCLPASAQTREMPDFTVETLSGSFSLSETLSEKKMVLINFFTSWCPPCRMEFPYMQEAYEQYADSVAVIALSIEENDSDEVLRSYAEELGLTFPVGSDSKTHLSSLFSVQSIPTTVIVDRFGQIVLVEVGAKSSVDDFLHLFDYMTSAFYTESAPLNGFPAGRADLEGETADTLLQTLGEDSRLTYLNPESPFVWPMQSVQSEDRLVLRSAAPATPGARSVLTVQTHAGEGDVLAFDVRTASTDGVNLLLAKLDGQEVRAFGGESEWVSCALPLPAGDHTIDFIFAVQTQTGITEYAELDSFALLSGEEAETALARNPVYPVSDQLRVTVDSVAASPLSFQDPAQALSILYGETDCYLVPESSARLILSLPEGIDPHRLILYSPADHILTTPAAILKDGVYAVEIAVPGDAASTSAIANLYLFATIEDALNESLLRSVTVFPGEDSIQALLSYLAGYGYTVTRNP